MTNFLTYDNINWQKYFFIFEKFNDVQCIFIIPQSQSNNCLKIGTINMMNIYDITFNKILNLNQIGPFITKKELTKDYNSVNIEKSVINYFLDNKYCKWLGIVDTTLECEYKVNNFINYLLPQPCRARLNSLRNFWIHSRLSIRICCPLT